jgi:hypothetical protein
MDGFTGGWMDIYIYIYIYIDKKEEELIYLRGLFE